MNFIKLVLLIIIFFQVNTVLASSTSNDLSDISSKNPFKIIPGYTIKYTSDSEGTLKIKDVMYSENSKWSSINTQIPSFGFSDSTFWFKFKITNFLESKSLLFEISYPLISKLEYYKVIDKKIVEKINLGFGNSFHDRPIDHRNYIIPLTLESHQEAEIYLKVNSFYTVQLPIKVWNRDSFSSISYSHELIQGLLYGAFLIFALYNLFLFATIKNSLFLHNVLFTISATLFLFSYSGYAYQYLWPNYPFIQNHIMALLIFCCFTTALLFTRAFLQLDTEKSFQSKINSLFIYIGILFIILSPLGPYKLSVIVGAYVAIFPTLSIVVVTITKLFKGQKDAKYLFAAGLLLFIGTLGLALNSLNILPLNEFTAHGVPVLTLFEVIFLSLALGDKIKGLELERVQAIEDYAEQAIHLEEVKRLEREKSSFFQNVSHEIRTPLTLIMTPLYEISKILKNNEYVEMALKNSNRLYRLVNQLLDFQKISHSNHELHLSAINIVPFIKSCGEYFRPICEKKNIKFNINYSSTNDIFIMGQIDALEKILFNYLSNSLKFTKRGYIGIDVKEIDNNIRITVLDTGIGVQKKDERKLFKVFTQTQEGSKREFEGSGLGLSLSKELAEKMNGEVGYHPGEDFGSCFWVEFPIIERQRKAVELLFVDKDLEQIEQYHKILRLNFPGTTFLDANTSDEARKILSKHRFKGVFTEESLYEEHGVDLLKYVHSDQSLAKKVLVTSTTDVEVFERAINESHVDKIIHKPCDDKELKEAIETCLKEVKIMDEIEVNLKNFTPKGWHIEDFESESSDNSELILENRSGKSLILVVDDLKDMRLLISNILKKREEFLCITACDGVDALDKINKYNPDLVLVDWMMPNLSGIELIDKLKKDEKHSSTPTVLLTAKNDDESKNIGTLSGANAYIGKPFSELELFSVIDNLLRLKKKEKEINVLNSSVTENILKRFLPDSIISSFIKNGDSFKENPKLKNLTILNFDLSEMGSAYESLGAKKCAEMLNQYLSEITKIAGKSEGYIDSFEFDSVTVLFGAKTKLSDPDQIKNAVKFITESNDRINRLKDEWNLPEINPRFSLHKGNVMIGIFGSEERSEYKAIGVEVEKTKKIKTALAGGHVIFSSEVQNFMPKNGWTIVEKLKFKNIDENKLFFKAQLANKE